MKSIQSLITSLFLFSGAVVLTVLLYPIAALADTYNAQIVATKGTVNTLTYSLLPASGTTNNITANAVGGNGSGSNIGTWVGTLSWAPTTNNTAWSSSFSNGAVTATWSISTPTPEITPVTSDEQMGVPTPPTYAVRALEGTPLLHVYLYDDYQGQSPTYTGADRYSGNTSSNTVAITETITSGTGSSAVVGTATAISGGYATSAHVVYNSNGAYDLAGQFTNALVSGQSDTFSVNPNLYNNNYVFKFSNAGNGLQGSSWAPVQNKLGSQATIHVFPLPTTPVTTWNPSPPFTSPTTPIYFNWSAYSVTSTISQLYPANFTYLRISTPSNTYYLYSNALVTNSDTAPTNTAATVLSSNNLTTTAPSPSSSSVSSAASSPESMTFVVNLKDLAAQIGTPPSGVYTFTVCSYTPNSPGSGGGWGTTYYTNNSTGQFTYTAVHHVSSGITTSPQ